VIVVRVDCVVGMTVDPLVTEVVRIMRLVNGSVCRVDDGGVGVIVVRVDSVVGMTVDPLVTEVVWIIRLVNGEVAVARGGVGVIVVKIDSVDWMTDDPLVVIGVVNIIRLVKGDVAGVDFTRDVGLRVVSGIVVVITNVRVRRVDILVSKVKTEDPLLLVEWITITVDIVDVIGEVIV
jgi:hypothetical protein